MKCSRCPNEIKIKKIKGLGQLCYACFSVAVSKMISLQEVWLNEDILPLVKQEIVNGSIKDKSFSIAIYIVESEFNEDIIKQAVEEMLDGDTLPERVRGCLNEYRQEVLGNYFGENKRDKN